MANSNIREEKGSVYGRDDRGQEATEKVQIEWGLGEWCDEDEGEVACD